MASTNKPKLPFQKRKQLQQDIDHITEQMYKRNKELADTNKTLSLLRTIDALVLESHATLKAVCGHISQAITQATDQSFVGIFTRPSHRHTELRLQGWSGHEYLGTDMPLGIDRPLHIREDASWFDALDNSHMFSLEINPEQTLNQLLDCTKAEGRSLVAVTKIKTLYFVKLTVRRRVVGVLAVGFYMPPEQLSETDTILFDRLSESIGVALDNKLLFEENQHVLRQLRDSNAKLKALDEAKDDFVSMASHQLRTPLTSVKGYISMVLEGDAGEINDLQKKLLGQSFASSQRMVYLIADLLNVSRLKTGKFLIERIPVNLADIVEQELSQLQDTARVHSLTIAYKKPATFTPLMLDETKTRQIIMNFVDNAIYYTPANGTITVELSETASTVEMRIIDDGIGVPKSEQPHLFTKFYRAGNARKARPDGTGLGLFMAKKVIVAQGGTLIFSSKEGEGSTFGFIFSKQKLAVTSVEPPAIAPIPSVAVTTTRKVKASKKPAKVLKKPVLS